MPLFQIGYRRYEGERTPRWLRWWPITRTGITVAWRSKLLRRLIFVSFLPFLYFGWIFFVIGRVTDPESGVAGRPFYELAADFLGRDLARRLQEDPGAVRTAVWSVVFAGFTTFFQLLIAGVVGAIVGPRLVASDLRTRAFLIYFARPISRLDYVIGKAGVLVSMLACVTLLPSIALYALSILFSPSLETLVQTFPVLLTVIVASLGSIVPAALILLALSSLTRQPRFAAAAWIVVCVFGPIAHEVLQATKDLKDTGWTFLVSIPHTIHTLHTGLHDAKGAISDLGVRGDLRDFLEQWGTQDSPLRAALWLGLLSVLCVLLLLRRVDAPTRV